MAKKQGDIRYLQGVFDSTTRKFLGISDPSSPGDGVDFDVPVYSDAQSARGDIVGVAAVDGSGGIYDAAGNKLALGGGDISKLKKFRVALGRLRNAWPNSTFKGVKVLHLGHSHAVGSGAAFPDSYAANGRKNNFVSNLARLFSINLQPANANGIFGYGGHFGGLATWDPRFTGTTGWAPFVLNNAIGQSLSSTTDGGVLVFAPTQPVDTFEIWYARSFTQGSFNWNVDGGANTLVNANGSNGLVRLEIPAGSLGMHTLNLTKSGTTRNSIVYFDAYNSAATNDREIRVIQGGQSGAKAADFAVSTNPWDAINEIALLAPDLTYLQLSVNDMVANTNIESWKSNMQAIINACLASGDVILSTDFPINTTQAAQSVQDAFVQAIKDLAAANNILYFDEYARFGNYASLNSLGFAADDLHPSAAGYGDHVQGFNSFLLKNING